MVNRNYWLDLFSGPTWQQFLDAGGEVSGFRERRWKTVQKIKPGDYLLCYMTGISRWIGVLEVTSEPFKDSSPLWKEEEFPCRLRVKIIEALTPETAVPVLQLRDHLSIFRDLKSPIAWTGYFRGSPLKFEPSDGEIILKAIEEAKRNPVSRPVDPRKLARRPRGIRTKIGPVTVPEVDEDIGKVALTTKEPSEHSEIQYLLLKLGNDMGLSVWVARNDRGREVKGQQLGDFPNCISELPLQFDEATNRTIQLIDVLWLQGNAIVAAFEIESTTSIYSGLLRLSDLIAMQPNLNIPLYLVAPNERRDKVIEEVNRPTFSQLSPPLAEMTQFIPFSDLRDRISEIESVVRHLKPDFLEDIAESCVIEDV